MFRDERDALQHQTEALTRQVKEGSEKLQHLQQEKLKAERENKQLKRQLSSLDPASRKPLWKRLWFVSVLTSALLAAGAFGALHFAKPRATLTWSATVASASGVSIAPGTRCLVSGTFSTNGKLDANVEALRIECGGSLVKNTVYPFGGEGWSLREERLDDALRYQLKQDSGDFRVDTSAQSASLYAKSNLSEPSLTFSIDPWSAPRSGAPLFAR